MKNKEELKRALKFFLFSCTAGIIQFGTTTILSLIWPEEKFEMGPIIFYLIGLILSVIYNVTINRKFTFKSTNNISIAILKTLGFYVIFAPLSALFQAWLTNGIITRNWTITHLNWHTIAGTVICMVTNLLLEFPFQRFVVFGKSIDSENKKC